MIPAHANLFPEDYFQALCRALNIGESDLITDRILTSLQTFQKSWLDPESSREHFAYDRDMVLAYSLFYMTLNMPKLWFMLHHLWPQIDPGKLAQGEALRVTELGCGPGTFLHAWRFYAQSHRWDMPMQFHGVDQVGGFLQTAERLDAAFGAYDNPLTTEKADWRQLQAPDSDVLILRSLLRIA